MIAALAALIPHSYFGLIGFVAVILTISTVLTMLVGIVAEVFDAMTDYAFDQSLLPVILAIMILSVVLGSGMWVVL